MSTQVLVDAGPLVALVDERDRYHEWAVAQWAALTPPLFTCEAVLAEACHLLRKFRSGPRAILEQVVRGVLVVTFALRDEATPVTRLMNRYANVPMSLADACLVRMAEIQSKSKVLTLDSDFRVYRKNGRQVIPAILPA
jgi:predicted nucleic acid-binding protein